MKRITVLALSLLLTAGIANARGGGPEGSGNRGGGPEEGRGGGNAIVAADGTIFVTRAAADDAVQILAITPAGTTAWTQTIADGRGHFTLSGSNLLFVSETRTDTAVTSTITARSTATGNVAWTATLNGRVTGLEPFSGGTYAIVVVPPATSGGSATRSLVAISNSGATLWTVAL